MQQSQGSYDYPALPNMQAKALAHMRHEVAFPKIPASGLLVTGSRSLNGIHSLGQPFLIAVIGGSAPETEKLVQRFPIPGDIGVFILPGIPVNGNPMTVICPEINSEDAIAGPAAMSKKRVALNVPEPFILHPAGNISYV